MTDKEATGGQFAGQLRQWLESAGIPFNPLQLPRPSGSPPLSLVINGTGLTADAVAVTLASYWRGTVQGLPLQIVGLNTPDLECMGMWLRHEPGVAFPADSAEVECTAEMLLVVPAGTVFGTHSVEAAQWALTSTPECAVLRAAVDGAPTSVEIWRASALAGDRQGAERKARRHGAERWTSGSALGLHYRGRPQPRPHLRRGPAGTLEMTVVVTDASEPGTKGDYLERIRTLEGEIARLRRAQWSAAVRAGRPVDAAKAAASGPLRSAVRYLRSAGQRR